MCGLTGIMATNFQAWEHDVFRKLLFLNVWRGEDSTGIIRVGQDKKIHSKKILLPSNTFISSEHKDIIEDSKQFSKARILMGHTRHATKGAVTLKNSHPFSFKDVVGMHNGTIHAKFKHRDEYETDSEAFYRNLNDYGLQEALNEIAAYDTAYAFQWIDKKAKTLNFIKNSKRPLNFTYAYGGTTLIWSSEQAMIEFVLKNKNYKTHEGWEGDTTDRFFTLEDNDHMSIPLGGHPKTDVSVTRMKVTSKNTYGGSSSTANFPSTTSRVNTTSGSNGGQIYTEGAWEKTDRGYRFVRKEGSQDLLRLTPPVTPGKTTTQPTTTSSPSQKATGTPKDGTSGETNASQSTTTLSKGSAQSDGSFRDRFGRDGLNTLQWLTRSSAIPAGVPETAQTSPIDIDEVFEKLANNQTFTKPEATVVPFRKAGGHTFKGYAGKSLTEAEFTHHLNNGCMCCAEGLSLNNVHDFEKINKIRWWSIDLWACDDCYENSTNDWVRSSIDDDWGDEPSKSYVKGET